MTDWVFSKTEELKELEAKAREAMDVEKDKPHFDELITAYVAGYIQSRFDDAIKALKDIKKDLEKTCGCEECSKLN